MIKYRGLDNISHEVKGVVRVGDVVTLREDINETTPNIPDGYNNEMRIIAIKANSRGGATVVSVIDHGLRPDEVDTFRFEGFPDTYTWNNCMVKKRDVMESISQMTL